MLPLFVYNNKKTKNIKYIIKYTFVVSFIQIVHFMLQGNPILKLLDTVCLYNINVFIRK